MAGTNLEAARSCGSCSLCCKILAVPDLDKAANVWCKHAKKTGGCGIYAKRPDACRRFTCLWLKDSRLGDDWKPDRCKMVLSSSMGGRGMRISVDPDVKDVWRSEPYYAQIKGWARAALAQSGYVAVFASDKCFIIFPEEDLEVSYIARGCGLRVGYIQKAGQWQPMAQVHYANGTMKEFFGGSYASLSFEPA
jgi:hypothetical protein